MSRWIVLLRLGPGRFSDQHPLDLIEAHLVGPSVVELGRPG